MRNTRFKSSQELVSAFTIDMVLFGLSNGDQVELKPKWEI